MELQNRKTSSMVEGGILSAVAIIFAIISVYLPILGVFVNLIWPVPILLLGVRHGVKWSLMCLMVSGIIIAIIVNPLQAISVVVGFGLIGVALGYGIRKEMTPLKTIFIGSIASFLSKGAVLIIGFLMMGINPIEFQFEATGQAIQNVIEIYRSMGLSEDQLTEMQSTLEKTISLMKIIMPAGFAIASILDTYINFWLAKAILKKLGQHIDDFPPFKEYALPDFMLWIYGVSLLLVTYYNPTPEHILYLIGANLQTISSLALLVQGVAITYYFIEKKGWPKFLKSVLVLLLFSSQFLVQLAVLLGAFDIFFNYRKLKKVQKSIL